MFKSLLEHTGITIPRTGKWIQEQLTTTSFMECSRTENQFLFLSDQLTIPRSSSTINMRRKCLLLMTLSFGGTVLSLEPEESTWETSSFGTMCTRSTSEAMNAQLHAV